LEHFFELLVRDVPLIFRVQKLIADFAKGSFRVVQKTVKFLRIESMGLSGISCVKRVDVVSDLPSV
jgi:hypothetical protein